MSGIQFKAPLTAKELSVYTDLFTKLDTQGVQGSGAVAFEHTIETLASASQVPKDTLKSIWELVDVGHRGQLRFKEFTALMRSVDRIEEYPNLPISSQLYEYPPLHPGSALGIDNSSSTPSSPVPPSSVDSPIRSPRFSSPSASASSSTRKNGPSSVGSPLGSPSGSPMRTSQQQQQQQQSPTQIPVPAISPNDVSKYSQLFDRTTGQHQLLSGAKARDIFLKARLSNTVLAEIWGLCDREANGTLDKQEFTVAMHLIGLRLSGHPSMNPVPKRLPQEVWNSVGLIPSGFKLGDSGPFTVPPPPRPPLQNMSPSPPVSPRHVTASPTYSPGSSVNSNLNLNVNASRSPHRANNNLQTSPRVHPSLLQPTTNTTGPTGTTTIRKRSLSPAMNLSNQFFVPYKSTRDDWKIPQRKQAEFEKLFDSLNEAETQRLAPAILVPFFMKSNLERDKLAIIWELCDVEKISGLSKAGFVVAMFLIQKFKAYGELPSVLPPELESFITSRKSNGKEEKEGEEEGAGDSIDAKIEAVVAAPTDAEMHSEPAPGGEKRVEGGSSSEQDTTGKPLASIDSSKDREKEGKEEREAEELAESDTKLVTLQNHEAAKSKELKDLQAEHHAAVTKLSSLNNDIKSTAAKIESLESKIQSTLATNKELEQQLTIAEANYHANEAKLDELEGSLRRANEENEKLTSDITKWESMTATLSSTLKTKQEEARVALSAVDYKKQQVDASELTVENLKKEIESLDKLVEAYIKKKAELEKLKGEATLDTQMQNLELNDDDDGDDALKQKASGATASSNDV